MTDQDSSRAAVQDTTRTGTNPITIEIYEVAFSDAALEAEVRRR